MSTDQLAGIAAYSGAGALVFLALAIATLERWRHAAKPAVVVPVVVRSAYTWAHCPNGHAKVLTNRDWSCPTCGAQMRAIDEHAAVWAAMEAA